MKLYCIGIGPGGEEQMTLRAVRALEKCDCVAGYGLYLDLIENLISDKERIESGMTREVLRCKAAVEAAKQGKTVAVVSSGDAGVYGRASINFYAFNSNGNKGIACGLNNLQKVRDGEPLGGKSRPEDDFADEDEDFLS